MLIVEVMEAKAGVGGGLEWCDKDVDCVVVVHKVVGAKVVGSGVVLEIEVVWVEVMGSVGG